MRRRSIVLLVALTFVTALAAAQGSSTPTVPPEASVPTIGGFISIGGQRDSASGEDARFRELNEGEQSGVFLDALQIRSVGANPWSLDAAYATGDRGWAEFRIGNGVWRGRAAVAQVSSWSALSFADEVLASGASVQSLYPGTTALDPRFDIDEPNVDLVWSEASIERDFGSNVTLVIRGGHRARDGSRIPNIGDFPSRSSGRPPSSRPVSNLSIPARPSEPSKLA